MLAKMEDEKVVISGIERKIAGEVQDARMLAKMEDCW